MLNSVEHGILNAHKYKNIKKFSIFQAQDKPRMLFFPLITVKMSTIVGILTFISRKNFMRGRVDHGKSFITSGPGSVLSCCRCERTVYLWSYIFPTFSSVFLLLLLFLVG